MKLRTISAGLALAAAAVMTGGAANASDGPSDAEVRTAIQNAVAGKATAADLEIIKNDPQLARTVPVSVKVGDPVVTEAAPPKKAGGRESAAALRAALVSYQQKCVAVDVPLTLTSWLGTTIYTWHHAFSYCTANQISGWETTRVMTVAPYNRGDYFSEKSSVVYPQGLVTDVLHAFVGAPIGTNTTGVGSRYLSHLARAVNLCIGQFSCYASNLPQSRLTIGRDGVAVELASAS